MTINKTCSMVSSISYCDKAIQHCLDIKKSYLKLLKREPDMAFLSYLILMMSHGWTIKEIEDDIKASEEFINLQN